MSIKILKLVNGEDVISTIEDGEEIVLDRPAHLMTGRDPETGQLGLGLGVWCPYSDKEKFTIDPDHVLVEIEEENIPEELIREYREKFGSGLVTPSSDLIL